VVAPSRPVTVGVSTPAPATSVVTNPGEVACIKSTLGACNIFSCADGTNINTCDLACKNEPIQNQLPPAVVSQSEILHVTPSATYPGSGTQVKVTFSPGANFGGYDAVIIGDKVVELYGGGKNSNDVTAPITATFLVPKGIFAGPSSLTLFNKQAPKQGVLWPGTFTVTPATDGPSIVSVTPTSGKVGDVIQVKIAKGKKEYNTPGFITIGGMATKIESSTYASVLENGGEYTLSAVVNANNTSGVLTLEQLSGEFAPVTSDTYFTVLSAETDGNIGMIESFIKFIGSFF
jgi:hypothetical protein